MTWFVIIALLLVGLSSCYLAYQVLPQTIAKRQSNNPTEQNLSTSNLDLLREALKSLENELSQGLIDQAQYQASKTDIERRALLEHQLITHQASHRFFTSKLAIAIAIALPVAVLLVYLWVGTPKALLPETQSANGQPTPAQIEMMVEKLAARMKDNPTDVQGWLMLGRSYAALNRLPEAKIALAKAIELDPKNADAMADLADLIAFMQQSAEGQPKQLIQQALAIDPNNVKALALAGSAAFESKDYLKAIDYWQRALKLTEPQSEFANGLSLSISNAQEKAGIKKPNLGSNVSGTLTISSALASQVKPEDTVFIYARAIDGPRMPVAILKIKASQLPFKFVLDDQLAMAPELSISKFKSVTIVARISKSGEATPKPGDLTGQIDQVAIGSKNLKLTIDKVAQ
jgi:cytochrome c-type biogenesis protein CcmH